MASKQSEAEANPYRRDALADRCGNNTDNRAARA